jgi:hypothetical protein
MTKAILAVLLMCASGALAQSPATPPSGASPAVKDCDDARIRYSPVDSKYAERLIVQPTTEPRPSGTPRTSPQRTHWLLSAEPDYSKAGPWTTNIWIGEGDNQTTVRLILKEHEGFSIQWLNEKLLYGSISWSKMLNTVFIFDVENNKFLYREMEDSSEMAAPCE